jgi:hypothetical protein
MSKQSAPNPYEVFNVLIGEQAAVVLRIIAGNFVEIPKSGVKLRGSG